MVGFGPIADGPIADTPFAAPVANSIAQTWGGWTQVATGAEQGGLTAQTWGGWLQAALSGQQGGAVAQTWGGWTQEAEGVTIVTRFYRRSVYGFNL